MSNFPGLETAFAIGYCLAMVGAVTVLGGCGYLIYWLVVK